MSVIIDELDAHRDAGSIDRAALVPGMYFAWCVNLQLIAAPFEAAHERDMLRLRYRELTPAAFFLKTAHGRLSGDLLSDQGLAFANAHYVQYRADTAAQLYDAKDDWDTYGSVAPALTKAYYTFSGSSHTPQPARHWWQKWRS